MIIKEFNIDDVKEVEAVSLVNEPATEETFDYYDSQKEKSDKAKRQRQLAISNIIINQIKNRGKICIKPTTPIIINPTSNVPKITIVEGDTETIIDSENLLYSNSGKPLWYRYAVRPGAPTFPNTVTRDFCKEREGNIYFIDEIKDWVNTPLDKQKEAGFIDSQYIDFFNNLPNYNMNTALYNCRHYLEAISNAADLIPTGKLTLYKTKALSMSKETPSKEMNFNIDFSIVDNEKMIVEGVVMIPNKPIYRKDIQGKGAGYVYFTTKTIEYLMHKFDSLANKYLTIDHSYKLPNNQYEILENKIVNGKWIMKVKIKDIALWAKIKQGAWKGYSIELIIK
jgi:hypothetical protein